jgi:uncharacterized repeat protein (TIGR03803 family)
MRQGEIDMRNVTQLPFFALRVVRAVLALEIVVGLVFGMTILADLTVSAQTYNVFSPGGGSHPAAGVTIRGDFVYGTTAYGGGGSGVVFEVKHLGDLVEFTGVPAPGPQSRVVFGPDGHLYGTYADGATNSFLFSLVPSATVCKSANCQPWKVNVLHLFAGFPSDGAIPGYGDLTWDQQGNIYGTTTIGGNTEHGVVYELMPPVPPSKTWTESVIWNFTGPDGEYPQNAVIFDGNGNLLGTARQGGANGFGTVFKLTPSGNGWSETNIYDFQGGADGQYPIAGLMMDGSGNLYGATSDAGSGGGGTVFELIPSGNSYTFKLLYSFSGQRNGGPWATLSMDSAGNLYGTTLGDGLGFGSVFKLTNNGGNWTYKSLHDFGSFRGDILSPMSNVSFDTNGNLWGTASSCGGGCNGGVWEIMP